MNDNMIETFELDIILNKNGNFSYGVKFKENGLFCALKKDVEIKKELKKIFSDSQTYMNQVCALLFIEFSQYRENFALEKNIFNYVQVFTTSEKMVLRFSFKDNQFDKYEGFSELSSYINQKTYVGYPFGAIIEINKNQKTQNSDENNKFMYLGCNPFNLLSKGYAFAIPVDSNGDLIFKQLEKKTKPEIDLSSFLPKTTLKLLSESMEVFLESESALYVESKEAIFDLILTINSDFTEGKIKILNQLQNSAKLSSFNRYFGDDSILDECNKISFIMSTYYDLHNIINKKKFLQAKKAEDVVLFGDESNFTIKLKLTLKQLENIFKSNYVQHDISFLRHNFAAGDIVQFKNLDETSYFLGHIDSLDNILLAVYSNNHIELIGVEFSEIKAVKSITDRVQGA